ncbi:DUF3861 domain-containing protein [Vibrio sp. SS-MA-C1-2]|uniref:DUF3861 domain-containing protein n=1 Tax=Vibrio sp. SS-MA-C1-2 TaxID=2908646 RepID=UPI001F475FE1|nr:DUF3861 domain-containing protein [Vibrio sp. SS-MA-C1-2]UJF20155.1 DUF3861 domain-containing protein [Vibrio sp. SS-MA-C1-2]
MTKTAIKGHRYRITIDEVDSNQQSVNQLQFELEDREDLFKVVESLKKGSGLAEDDATKVGVAIRLLGPVMMKDRKHPLFIDFMPHFKNFMQNLKGKVKAALS